MAQRLSGRNEQLIDSSGDRFAKYASSAPARAPSSSNPGEAVSTHTILEAEPYPSLTMSASGARLKPIRSVAVLPFFEWLAAPVQDICRHVDAWGAFEDDVTLIGAALWRECPAPPSGPRSSSHHSVDGSASAASCFTWRSRQRPRLEDEGSSGPPSCAIEARFRRVAAAVCGSPDERRSNPGLGFIAEALARTQGGQT